MPKRSHEPQRTCLGCGKRGLKISMIRLVAPRADMVVADPEGKAPGRGGYLHRDAGCLEKFEASRVKQFRSLKVRIDRPERLKISEEIRRLLDRAAKVE
jgi:predicted RNA-binding protein YlxR (DUF448 family)